MAEYIDKWSVVNKLIDLENEFQQYKPFHGFEHAMYRKVCEAEIAIGKTPAADVVEVPCRCKDCKHWMDFPNCGCTEFVKVCALAEYMIGQNGYCLYGEQKEVNPNG